MWFNLNLYNTKGLQRFLLNETYTHIYQLVFCLKLTVTLKLFVQLLKTRLHAYKPVPKNLSLSFRFNKNTFSQLYRTESNQAYEIFMLCVSLRALPLTQQKKFLLLHATPAK
jgi:hypothetical protein